MKFRSSSSHSGGHNEKKMISTPMQEQLAKLASNTLLEFKVGFKRDELTSPRDVRHLIKVIEDQYFHRLKVDKHSCLKSIRIGWSLPRCVLVPMIQDVLPLLLKQPANVTHLQLELDCWIPETALKRIVSWHTIQKLELTGIRIQRRTVSDVRHNREKSKIAPTDRFSDRGVEPVSTLKDDSIVGVIPFISESVETLKLVENDLQGYHISELCESLRHMRHVKTLSLRHNRDLTGCWNELFSLPYLKSLDLSICDLDIDDGLLIASALKKNNSLVRLSVAGNYRMSEAIPSLMKVASQRLVSFDCSFCELNGKSQRQIFHVLAHAPKCTLRSLKMQGTRIKNVDGIVQCISENKSLQNLILDHPREPFNIASADVSKIMNAVKHNYYLQNIQLDVEKQDRDIVQREKFWLDLNKCGRSLLLQENDSGKSFTSVIQSAAMTKNEDVIYWLLKHGANQL